MEIAKVQSTEASNAIEGNVTTSTRMRRWKEKTTTKNRDEQEIAYYRDVLNIIHESFDAIPLSQNYILQLHKIMYSHMNNLWPTTKNTQNYITQSIHLHAETPTPLAPFETPKLWIKSARNSPCDWHRSRTLIAILIFIHDFCIHPFNDGNGRMSRLLPRFCST